MGALAFVVRKEREDPADGVEGDEDAVNIDGPLFSGGR